MFRTLARLLNDPTLTNPNAAYSDQVFRIHPYQLSQWLEQSWAFAEAATFANIPGQQPFLGDPGIVAANLPLVLLLLIAPVLAKLVLVSQEMARPFAAPPGLPADRKAALITAFEQTMKDRAFLAEAKTQVLDVDPVSAREIDALLAEVYATPKSVTDKAARATTAE